MNPKPKTHTIRDFDDLTSESKLLPGNLNDDYVFQPRNELEEYFLDAADKHGVVDEMFSERCFDEDYYGYSDDLRDF